MESVIATMDSRSSYDRDLISVLTETTHQGQVHTKIMTLGPDLTKTMDHPSSPDGDQEPRSSSDQTMAENWTQSRPSPWLVLPEPPVRHLLCNAADAVGALGPVQIQRN